MKNHLLLLCALALTTGCGAVTLEDFRNAAPSGQGLELKMAEKKSASQGLRSEFGQTQQGLLGAPALMPGVTALATGVVNGGVGLTLGVVRVIVAQEPTTLTATKATWGPYTEPLWRDTYRFTMTHDAQGFHYSLEGKPKTAADTAYVALLTGDHVPAGRDGSGAFKLDWDAAQNLAGGSLLIGHADVTYSRNANGDVKVGVAFRQVGNVLDKKRADSDYAFEQVRDGDGFFTFSTEADFHNRNSAKETFRVNSRWHNDGAGRADVVVSGGDLTTAVRFTECWASDFGRSYYQDTLAVFPTEGAESACSFAQPSFPTP